MHLILFLIGYIDMRDKKIPDELSFILFLLLLIRRSFNFKGAFLSFIFFNLAYFFLYFVFDTEPLGYGDIKLFSLMALALKGRLIGFYLLSFTLAGLLGLVLFIRGHRKKELAMAPFIILSFIYFY